MIKRAFDIFAACFGLLVFSPLLAVVMLGIWLQDRQSPFYIAPRVARGGGARDRDCVRRAWGNARA